MLGLRASLCVRGICRRQAAGAVGCGAPAAPAAGAAGSGGGGAARRAPRGAGGRRAMATAAAAAAAAAPAGGGSAQEVHLDVVAADAGVLREFRDKFEPVRVQAWRRGPGVRMGRPAPSPPPPART
jgi:hypothetical protein